VNRRGFLGSLSAIVAGAVIAPQLAIEKITTRVRRRRSIQKRSGMKMSLADYERDMITIYSREKVVEPYQRAAGRFLA
jgi:hypothetical protein